MFRRVFVLALFILVACGDDDASPDAARDTGGLDSTADVASDTTTDVAADVATDVATDTPPGARPHPQYPALDLDTLPGGGGGTFGPFTPPTLPTTTRMVTVGTTGMEAGAELEAACAMAGTEVTVPSSAGRIGVINLGNVFDCDITLGADVVIDFLVVGSLRGPMQAPSERVRIRGGQIGSLFVKGPSADLVFDGVTINAGVMPPASRPGTGINMPTGDNEGEFVERLSFVNSFVRMLPIDAGGGNIDGTCFLGTGLKNALFANNNIVTAGNRNSWGFRFNGGDNILLVDNSARVSFHKLVRMNSAPVDYVYIKGGTWMREATRTAGGDLINDSFQQLSGSTTDNIFVHDPVVYLLADNPVGFGMTFDDMQSGRSWEARRIEWHALNADVVSDDRLGVFVGACPAGATCDYGIGTHSYEYDPGLTFPADPWRDLPAIDDDDPDNLPIAP